MGTCSKCGAEAGAGAKFCKTCGQGVQAGHDEKKARVLNAEQGSKKVPLIIAAAVILVVVGFVAYSSYGNRGKGGMMRMDAQRSSQPESAFRPVKPEGGEIRISEDAIKGATANYYSYAGAGKTVKFFVLKAADGTVRVALDACTACYHAKLGYRQDSDNMICNNCGMAFRSTDVGKITGGCSPVPVETRSEGKLIVVKVADLEAGAKYF